MTVEDRNILSITIDLILSLASSTAFFVAGVYGALGDFDIAIFLMLMAIWLKLSVLD